MPTNHGLIVQFNEAMNENSLTSDKWELVDSLGNQQTGELVYNAEYSVWKLAPDSSLIAGEQYSVTISGEIQDEGGSNPLGSDLSWSFKTSIGEDNSALEFAERWPGSGCDCAPISTRVLVKFDQVSDPDSISESTMVLHNETGSVVAGSVLYRGDFIEFKPDQALSPDSAYSVQINAGTRDLAGQTMTSEEIWNFRTSGATANGSWTEMGAAEQVPAMAFHNQVWTGSEVIFWGSSGGGIYRPVTDHWSTISTVNAPLSRNEATAVWTGSEMIVWGGRDENGGIPSGGIYTPNANVWSVLESPSIFVAGATYQHVAAWTGTEMIIWGGISTSGSTTSPHTINKGFRYNPQSQVWTRVDSSGILSPRRDAASVWTGSELVIWGGYSISGDALNDGARYDPQSDIWRPLPTENAPVASTVGVSVIWTGSEVIVWNGGRSFAGQKRNDQFRSETLRFYDPLTDQWRKSNSGWEPYASTDGSLFQLPSGFSAHWTGDRMFVLAKLFPGGAWFYDPALDGWQPASTTGAPFALKGSSTLWAGDRFIHWGGDKFSYWEALIDPLSGKEGKYFLP
jgi:N-acetylneuraminic acid mutarotase